MSEFSKTRIRFRRGTAAQWSAANPVVLASGEPGFITDTNTLKIGNGTTTFASLSAVAGGGGGGSLDNIAEDITPQLGGNLDVNSKNIIGTGNVALTGSGTFMSVIKSGGTSSQFLKADGSVDSNTYLTSTSALSNIVEDTSPQLGGALDAQSNNITSVGSLGVGGGVTFEKGLTVNNAGAGTSSDFRVRGDNDTYLLFTDAANDKVGISTQFPSHTFSVSGDINATTIVKQGGTSSQFLKADGSSDSNSYQQILSEGAFANGDKTKLDAVEASADVTDATNVNAAGAVMNTDTTTASMDFVVDEDNMSSDSATKIPTQQSVKAYVDANSGSTLTEEQVEDFVGGMVTGNTETGITVTYQDDDGTLDFVVASQTDENFTTADHSKLDGIEASADVTDTANVTSAGALMDSELTDLAGVKGVTISTLQAKPSEGAFANGDKTKLDAIEAGADVTDTANVTAAGALMDSELTDLAGVKGVTILNLQVKPSEGSFADGDKTKLDSIETNADVTDTTNVTSAGALMDSELTDLAGVKGVTISTLQVKPSEGAFANGDKTKLDAIEASADVTDAANVNAAGAVMNSDSSTASMSFVVDEDNMSSNSATKVPTQQSVKAYVDSSSDIVGDTSPQLGGALDVNSNNIIGTGNIAISGTGTMAKIGVGLGNGTPAFNLDVTGSGRFVHADGACGLFVQDVSGSGLHFGDCALSANANFAGIKHTHYTGTSDYMMVSDGSDTYISAKDGNSVILRAGGNAGEGGITISDVGAGGAGVVFNEAGSDRDIRMESAGSTNMFRLDASANSIGLNTGTPSHTLAVSGDINAQNVYVSGAPATKSDTTGITGASGVANLVYISSGDYAALSSYSSSTIYFIR